MNHRSSVSYDIISRRINLPRTMSSTSIHSDNDIIARQDHDIPARGEHDIDTPESDRNITNMGGTIRVDSDPPPSYSASANHHLCPEGTTGNESLTSHDSRPLTSASSDSRLFTSSSHKHIALASSAYPSSLSDSANVNNSTSTKYQTASPYPSDNPYSKADNYQTSSAVSSEQRTRISTSCLPSAHVATASSSPVGAMTSSASKKRKDEIQKLVSGNPELRDNIYALLASTITAVEAQQPDSVKAKDSKIEELQRQLLESLNYGNDQARKVEELQASLKVATDTGLSQIETLEELHDKIKRQEDLEKNIRKGTLVLNKELDISKAENTSLKRKLKDAEKEIGILANRFEYQTQTFEILSQKARQAERMTMRMENDLDKLEKENHLLVLKGEQMSSRLMNVAEQWHDPGLGARKRQAEEVLDDGERLRRFTRMTR
jgi:hypothetical protein